MFSNSKDVQCGGKQGGCIPWLRARTLEPDCLGSVPLPTVCHSQLGTVPRFPSEMDRVWYWPERALLRIQWDNPRKEPRTVPGWQKTFMRIATRIREQTRVRKYGWVSAESLNGRNWETKWERGGLWKAWWVLECWRTSTLPADKWDGGISRRRSCMSKDVSNWPHPLPPTAPSPLVLSPWIGLPPPPHHTITTSCSRNTGVFLVSSLQLTPSESCWFYIPHISQIIFSISLPISLSRSLCPSISLFPSNGFPGP